jgi:hypothetical protein
MEKEDKLITKNDMTESFLHSSTDNSSFYTQHYKPFTIHIDYIKKLNLNEILNKKIEKNTNENSIFLMRVQYTTDELMNRIDWEIHKSVQIIKNLLTVV